MNIIDLVTKINKRNMENRQLHDLLVSSEGTDDTKEIRIKLIDNYFDIHQMERELHKLLGII